MIKRLRLYTVLLRYVNGAADFKLVQASSEFEAAQTAKLKAQNPEQVITALCRPLIAPSQLGQ